MNHKEKPPKQEIGKGTKNKDYDGAVSLSSLALDPTFFPIRQFRILSKIILHGFSAFIIPK